EQALRLNDAGFIFAASCEPFEGEGPGEIHEVVRRLLQMAPGQHRYNPTANNVVGRVTFFVDKALYLRTQQPNLRPIDFWMKVSEIAGGDETVRKVQQAYPRKIRQAMFAIVDKYRAARQTFIRRGGFDLAEGLDAPNNDTNEARVERKQYQFKLRKLWALLDQLQELQRIRAHEKGLDTRMRNKSERESINGQENEAINNATASDATIDVTANDTEIIPSIPHQTMHGKSQAYVNEMEQHRLQSAEDDRKPHHELVAERDQFREQARQSEMWIEHQAASGRKLMEAMAEAEYWKLEAQELEIN
ncbi:hypothetical protein CMUS01_16479, partial [Colletotrichum musicola]